MISLQSCCCCTCKESGRSNSERRADCCLRTRTQTELSSFERRALAKRVVYSAPIALLTNAMTLGDNLTRREAREGPRGED